MQFFSSSQFPVSNAKLPQARAGHGAAAASGAHKLDCGWYDSSFDLARGLEVVEDDDHTLYQLWEMSRR
jgi:hypothetical protein